MKIVNEPPKVGIFAAVFIDEPDHKSWVCKWEEELDSFVHERETYHGMQWWPIDFRSHDYVYIVSD